MLDRRAAPRYVINIAGVLMFDDSHGEKKTSSCKILDLSEGGARLGVTVTDVSLLPARVVLFETANGNVYECDIRWRKPNEVGVQFIDVVSRTHHKEMISRISRMNLNMGSRTSSA